MFKEICLFEARLQLKRHLTWICAVLFFLVGFALVVLDLASDYGAGGLVKRDAPFVIMRFLLDLTLGGVFLTTAFVASAVQRDFERDTASTFLTTPITKWSYLGGRFCGALAVALVPFLAALVGIAAGAMMPWVDAELVGPFTWTPYVVGFGTIVVPVVLLIGAISFSVATLTRSMLYTYVVVVAVFIGWGLGDLLARDLVGQFLAGLIDPFGYTAFTVATQYWTVFEKSTMVLPVGGLFLWSRLLWLGVAAVIFGFTLLRFQFTVLGGRRHKQTEVEDALVDTAVPTDFVPSWVTRRFTAWTALVQWWYETRREFIGIIKSTPFLVILLLAVGNFTSSALLSNQFYGNTVYPVTWTMVEAVANSFLFIVIVITFYSGDLIWKERTLKLDEVWDSLPTPTWAAWASKLTALCGAIGLILLSFTLTAIGVQIARGVPDVELTLYLKGVFAIRGTLYVLLIVLAFALQVAANNKYLGLLGMVVFLVAIVWLPALGFDHYLYRYGIIPRAPYSDMNGFGHFVAPTVWFNVYWGLCAVILLALSHMFWVRGTDTTWRWRRCEARRRLSRSVVSVLGLGFVGFVATGSFIYYNTNVLNRYETSDHKTALRVEFEKKYKRYEGLPRPCITAVVADVAIYPETRRAVISGRYTLHNKTDSMIDVLLVGVNRQVARSAIGIPSARLLEESDSLLGIYLYGLDDPMAPGDSLLMAFEATIHPRGFVNNGSNTDLVYNGTFLTNDYFPYLGYDRTREIRNPNERRKQGLPEADLMPPLSDDPARRGPSSRVDWVQFETTVSTSQNQIAVAPGYLQREWEENGRRYFHYLMDIPIPNAFAYLSADYSVLRDHWNDVNIDIYYHRPHTYNLDRMVESIKQSLTYFTRSFGPYQYRQIRIVEFPRYASFALALPNTIPYSEGIGFITRIDGEDDIDTVFFITAHEVAHQWWGGQVCGAWMQGYHVMTETMAQYSALMVMEKEYGPDKVRRYLRYQLDQYLQGRGGERLDETPLMYEQGQGYVAFNKGSLVMYALRDYIGEDNLNAALARYLAAVAYRDAPYTNSREFVSYLREATPDSLQYLIEDMFETITLFDNQATDVTYRQRDDGTYVVTMTVEAHKVRADGKGVETEIEIGDWIDIGVFGEELINGSRQETVLYMQKHKITDSVQQFELFVDREPVRAGIDPYNKLIDRNPEDNVRRVQRALDSGRVSR